MKELRVFSDGVAQIVDVGALVAPLLSHPGQFIVPLLEEEEQRSLQKHVFANSVSSNHQWSHATRLRLVTPAPGDLAPDLVVQLQYVVDRRLIFDRPASDVVASRVQVIRALGAQTLQNVMVGDQNRVYK